jgi:hypothetical protein
MSESWAIIIAAAFPSILSFVAVILGLRNKGAISDVHVSLNGRLTELLAARTNEARLQGIEQGRREAKP